jgi:hypothetical protein
VSRSIERRIGGACVWQLHLVTQTLLLMDARLQATEDRLEALPCPPLSASRSAAATPGTSFGTSWDAHRPSSRLWR